MTDLTAVLRRETAHLPQTDRDLIERRLIVAVQLHLHFPRADEQALTTKLQSFGECPRWVCTLIARAALETLTGVPASAAAA